MTLSDAFADVEPEEHLSADQRVQPGIAHRQVLPVSGLGAADQLADAFTDGRNVAGLRWGELDGSVLQESLELRATLGQQVYRWCDCDERGGELGWRRGKTQAGVISLLLCNEIQWETLRLGSGLLPILGK